MANLKFSELPAASAPTGSEIVPVVQGGDSKRTTLSAIKTYVLTGLTVAWSAITGKPTTLSGYGITDAATSAQGALADTATQPGDLATVATSGSYADLTGKPTILPDAPSDGTGYVRKDGAWAPQATGGAANWGDIGGDIADQDDLQTALGEKADTATTLAGYGITDAATSAQGALADTATQPGDLATVATSGAYNDLSGKPTLGTAAAAATSDFATAAQGAKADTAVQPAGLSPYAPLASPALTGTPTVPTASPGTNTTQAASTAYADAIAALKANLASPTLTGTPAAPTASAATNTTQIATTAFVQGEIAAKAPLASPTFTGTPAAPTAAIGTDTTQLATTAHVMAAVSKISLNSQSAAYTTVAADKGKAIFHPAADTTARTFTIDSNANVPYDVGTTLTFINQNAGGVITIAITSDTMRLAGAGTTGNRTLAANGIATATKIATTEWLIAGTGLT